VTWSRSFLAKGLNREPWEPAAWLRGAATPQRLVCEKNHKLEPEEGRPFSPRLSSKRLEFQYIAVGNPGFPTPAYSNCSSFHDVVKGADAAEATGHRGTDGRLLARAPNRRRSELSDVVAGAGTKEKLQCLRTSWRNRLFAWDA
jgi:hypothetical protein